MSAFGTITADSPSGRASWDKARRKVKVTQAREEQPPTRRRPQFL
jgi:hypothetical protein